MELLGSCHCKAVTFTVEADQPYPFNRCYCSICRKTAGSGGYAINLGADFRTLTVSGSEHVSIYRAKTKDPGTGIIAESTAERSFCKICGSALWLWDPRWPDQVHPQASAIDTELPVPPTRTHMMLDSKMNWVQPDMAQNDKSFGQYPDESLAAWHKRVIEQDPG